MQSCFSSVAPAPKMISRRRLRTSQSQDRKNPVAGLGRADPESAGVDANSPATHNEMRKVGFHCRAFALQGRELGVEQLIIHGDFAPLYFSRAISSSRSPRRALLRCSTPPDSGGFTQLCVGNVGK